MKQKKVITHKILFFRILFFMLFVGIIFAYFSTNYMKEYATDNLAQEDAKKTSQLVFEVLYTKMQDGWSQKDLKKIISRLNKLKTGMKIKTYRTTLVEELYGKVALEKDGENDSLVQGALNGKTIFLKIDNGNKIRYIRPITVEKKCIKCHSNTKIGDINGAIDITFPITDIKIPLNKIIQYFLIFTIIAIIATFFIFQFLMNIIFIKPISSFVDTLKEIATLEDYNINIATHYSTYEMEILKNTFNTLFNRIALSINNLSAKNKMLQEYKKAIDESTIVSKTDKKGYITFVNEQFCKISGYSKDELIGKNHNIVRSNNMKKELFEELWKTIKNKKVWHGIIENQAKNGDSYFVKATIVPILNEENEIIEYIGIRQDITDLKTLQQNEIKYNAEKALTIKYNQILEYIPTNAIIVDSNSIIQHSNRYFNNKFSHLNSERIAIDTLFIQREGFISNDNTILDWKESILDLQETFTNKVLVNLYSQEKKFLIYLNKLNNNNDYLIIFIEIDDNGF